MPSGFRNDGSGYSGHVFVKGESSPKRGWTKLDHPRLSNAGRKRIYLWLTITCRTCGRIFQAPSNKKREYCSKGCADASKCGIPSWNKGLTTADPPVEKYIAKLRGRPRPSKIPLSICPICQRQFRARKRGAEKQGQFCSAQCYGVYRSRHYHGVKAPRYGKKHSEETKQHLRAIQIERLQNPLLLRRILSCRVPNKCEKKLSSILHQLGLSYLFVGDGSLVIRGQNPDFVNFKKRKIIELFGQRWHEPAEQQIRLNFFKEHGYDALIIWDNELKSVDSLIDKISAFDTANNSERGPSQALASDPPPESGMSSNSKPVIA